MALWRSTVRLAALQLEWLEAREVPADLRIVSYNATSENGTVRPGMVGVLTDGDTTNDHGFLDTIGVQPAGGVARPVDVFLLQETDPGLVAVQTIVTRLNSYYGAGTYAAGSAVGATTGSGTQGIVYRTGTVDLVAQTPFGTVSDSGAGRQSVRYRLRPDGTTTDVYVYNAHMKAADTPADAQRRLVEARAIRADADALGAGANVLYVGDFNFYDSDSSEPAYAQYRASGAGQAVDVANPAGNWKRDSNSWVPLYTQAPANNPPGGLTGGGLDDRFDFVLMSAELTDGAGPDYRPGTYRTFGVNNSLPANSDVNAPGNTALNTTPLTPAERQRVLDYLTTVADHLPVVVDFSVPSGALQFAASALTAGESAGAATVTVTRTGGAAGAVTVAYAATAGTATAGVDFSPVSGTLTFAAGQTSATFTVPVLPDTVDEPDETVSLTLTSATGGATLGTPAAATLTIADDDLGYAVNGGGAQRSRVTSVVVRFDAPFPTALTAADFTLAGFAGTLSVAHAAGGSTATLTFSGTGTEAGSLADGRYTLTVNPPGLSNTTFAFHRLFGDVNGDAAVDTLDLARFRQAFSGAVPNPAFDFNGDGLVDTIDLGRFRQRFGVVLPP